MNQVIAYRFHLGEGYTIAYDSDIRNYAVWKASIPSYHITSNVVRDTDIHWWDTHALSVKKGPSSIRYVAPHAVGKAKDAQNVIVSILKCINLTEQSPY